MSRGTDLQLRDLVTGAEGGGYTLPTELLDAYATFVRVKALSMPTPQVLDPDTAAARIVSATAAGEPVDLVAIATEVAEIELGKQRHDQAAHIMRLAIEQAGERAQHLAADMVERVITEHLRPAHEHVLEQAREVAAALDGYAIDNTHALLGAPTKVRTAYLKLPELVARRSVILTARRMINALGYRDAKHDNGGLFASFRTPLALKSATVLRVPPIPWPDDPTARLLWVVSAAAAPGQPWLPTISEQDAAWMDEYGEAVKARQGQQGWSRVL